VTPPEIQAVLDGQSQGCVVCADCLDVLPELPEGCVHLVCTDPPYIGLKGGYDRQGLGGGVAERRGVSVTVSDPWKSNLALAQEADRIALYGLMVFCTHHFLPELAGNFSACRRVALLTWYKRNAAPTGKNVPYFKSEFIWCFAKRPGLAWDALYDTVLDIPNLQGGCLPCPERCVDPKTGMSLHPTQKPLALMRQLLTVGGKIVLDPFCGTGTTCVAAKMLGRRYIGIDISEEYCNIARARLASVDTGVPVREARQGQLSLFQEPNP
jgi:hypothetical protein